MSVLDSRLVVSSNPVRGRRERRGCSGLIPTHWAFKNTLRVEAGTEMRTQYLVAHKPMTAPLVPVVLYKRRNLVRVDVEYNVPVIVVSLISEAERSPRSRRFTGGAT